VSDVNRFSVTMLSTMTNLKDTPNFRRMLTPEMEKLAHLFASNGHEIRIAGGAVRDLLRGLEPADVDFATTATPTQMKDMFTRENIRMINEQGEKHGTITARIDDTVNFEVTTLRIDKVTDGRRAEVEYTLDWEIDANRRDLTINSMFLGMDGTVYDYFNGEQDLKELRVRFVGKPEQRIQEDYLRILRYFRFYGRIAKTSDQHCAETLKAIAANVEGLSRVSGERIWSEFKKILAGNFAGELTLEMIKQGLGQYIGLSEDPNVEEFSAVWKKCEKSDTKLLPQTLLSALFRTEDDVLKLHGRLRLSGLERDNCLFVVENRCDKMDPVRIRPYQYLLVDSRSKMADTRLYISEVLKYRGEFDLLDEFNSWDMPRFPVTGHHLKENGCPPGKAMSVVLTKLKDKWKESNFSLSLEALVELIPQVLDSISVDDLKAAPPIKRKKRDRSNQRVH